MPAVSADSLIRPVVPNREIQRAAGFTHVDPQFSGILFTNTLSSQRHVTNNILLNGSGVACGDVDGDGLADVYFCRLDGANVLYKNLGGWRFQEATAHSGLACDDLDATGTALADVDGDRDIDAIVNSITRGTFVFCNDGKGRFTRSSQGPLNVGYCGSSLALADLNGDGSLDLYVANYRTVTIRDQPNTRFNVRVIDGKPVIVSVNSRPMTDPDLTNRFTLTVNPATGTAANDENGEPHALFFNDGRGQFTQVPFTGGAFVDEAGRPLTQTPYDWGLSVMMRDLDGDGFPDIYVCNDFKSPDRIWMNDGAGKFRAIAPTAIRQTSLFSMGVDVADINRDGHFDIFMADMLSRSHQKRLTQKADLGPEPVRIGDVLSRAQYSRNALLLARGDGTFAEIAQFAGVEASGWSWTSTFLDVDLDGYEDLLVVNGFERDGMNMDIANELKAEKMARRNLTPLEQLALRARYPRLATPNVAFRNLGNSRFADASAEWNFDQSGVSQGMALADLDNDGDLDVVISNMNGPAFLLRNDTMAPRVAVRLKGIAPNTAGIGAKITVTGGPVPQMQEMISGGRYLSSDDTVRTFAAGSITNKLRVEVVWRSGKRSVVEDVSANSICEVDERGAASFTPAKRVPAQPLFEDWTARLNHRHTEELFDDFARQPLLPRRLSQFGPGVSWSEADGRAELAITSGRSGALAVFACNANGTFSRVNNTATVNVTKRDQTTVLGWRDAQGRFSRLVGFANYEDMSADTAVVQRFDDREAAPVFPAHASSIGPLAMADVDGDGALDLFIGGRVIPLRYPEPASSFLLRQSNGTLVRDDANCAALTNIGLVSGASFTDLDANGAPDLIVACEWGPLKIFRNSRGALSPWNAPVTLNSQPTTLNQLPGWWTSVAAGDFNGDGWMDFVAGNWGENTKYEFTRSKPLRIYFGDYDNNGIVDLIESYFDAESQRYVPAGWLSTMQQGMPWLPQRFPTWDSFSRASAEDVVGSASAVRYLEASTLSTMVFLNRGDRFEAVRLPDEAQFSSAFGIAVADFNGDGNEDIFLAQNFFAASPETPRLDAGRGLLLVGDGVGRFRTLSGQESGIAIYGEQRGAAVADFDGDGRIDLAVSQNGAETKLLHNKGSASGLRVRLSGPAANRDAIGAVLRVGDGQRWGAAREIHAGGGYWSQDSTMQVLARTGNRIQVRWPGGATTVSEIPRDALEVLIDSTGALKTVRSGVIAK